jgi:hypothetical protein
MNLYQEYADVCRLIEELEAKKAALVPQVLVDMQSKDLSFTENDFGNWAIVKHKTYTYSKDIKAAEERLSMEKEAERENGTATALEKSVLRFKAA